jgi:hypothetical protein
MGAVLDNNVIYLSITDGKISRRVKEQTEGSVQRTTKEGKIVHELLYKGWKGRITNISTKDHPTYGRSWLITLSDDDGDAVLQMNYSSGYSSAFLKTLPNIDFSKDVTLIPSIKMEGDKKKTSLFVMQDGSALKHFWNKDNPGECPSLEKTKVKKNGKVTEEWNDYEMMIFLERYVTEKVLPKLKNAKAVTSAPVTAGEDEESDDLPF